MFPFGTQRTEADFLHPLPHPSVSRKRGWNVRTISCIVKSHDMFCSSFNKMAAERYACAETYPILTANCAARLTISDSPFNATISFAHPLATWPNQLVPSDYQHLPVGGLSTGHSLKGKAIPLPAWTSPQGSRNLRLSDFKKIGT
jgi:hypothetical protein